MDYEKKYKEALERANKQRANYQKELDKTEKNSKLAGRLRAGISAIDMAFPELAESEDERIRKGLIEIFNSALGQDFLQRKAGLDRDKVIAYLEKQKGKMTADEFENSELFQLKLKTKYHNGYQDGMVQRQEKQNEQPITANDLDEEMDRFFEGMPIQEHENIFEDTYQMIARHFAKWGEGHKEQNEKPLKPELEIPGWEHWDNEYMINTVIGRYSLHAEVAKKHGDTHDYNLSKSMENWLRNVVKPLILEKQKELHYADKRVDDIMNMPELSAFEQALTNFIGYWEDDEEHWPSQFVKKHGKHILDMAREELQKEQKPLTAKEYHDKFDEMYGQYKPNLVEQKPAEWSDEDKSFYDSIMCEVIKEGMHPTPEQANWFKLLPERFNPQSKQEWSEEDEKIAKEIEEELWYPGDFPDYPSKEENELYDDCQRRLNWFKDKLKSLRPQPHWKPSEEHLSVYRKEEE